MLGVELYGIVLPPASIDTHYALGQHRTIIVRQKRRQIFRQIA
jgi:hypothetical protein